MSTGWLGHNRADFLAYEIESEDSGINVAWCSLKEVWHPLRRVKIESLFIIQLPAKSS